MLVFDDAFSAAFTALPPVTPLPHTPTHTHTHTHPHTPPTHTHTQPHTHTHQRPFATKAPRIMHNLLCTASLTILHSLDPRILKLCTRIESYNKSLWRDACLAVLPWGNPDAASV